MDINTDGVFEIGQFVEDGEKKLKVINKKKLPKNGYAYLLTNNKSYYIFSPHLCMRQLANGFNREPIENIELAQKGFFNFEGD